MIPDERSRPTTTSRGAWALAAAAAGLFLMAVMAAAPGSPFQPLLTGRGQPSGPLHAIAVAVGLGDLHGNVLVAVSVAITLLAIGLVLCTMVIVAVVAHMLIPGLSWGVAFVLGAVVSPTDPTAATAIAERFGLPRRLVALIEGESLVNDGTALVAYKFAVIAVVSGTFSFGEAAGR